MEFIEHGIDGGDEEGNEKGSADLLLNQAQCPGKKRGENRVFGQMRAFADNELDRRNCCIRNAGSEPAEERTDESRGVFRGKQIGGADEDENHPGEDRQPEFEKSAHRKRNHNRAACANFAA